MWGIGRCGTVCDAGAKFEAVLSRHKHQVIVSRLPGLAVSKRELRSAAPKRAVLWYMRFARQVHPIS